MPSFFSFLPWRRPGVPGGITKLAWPRWPRAGSTVATTTCRLAMPPLVMKTFWPFRTQSSPSRTARVRRLETSDPAPGSVTANAPTLGSAGVPNSSGVQRVTCSGVPLAIRATRGRPLPKMAREMPAQPQQSSSTSSGWRMPVSSSPIIR